MSTPTAVLGDDPLARSLEELRLVMEAAPAAAEQVAKDAAVEALDRRWKRLYVNTIFGVGVVLVVFLVGILILLSRLGTLGAQVTDQDAAIQRSVTSIAAFQKQLDDANAKLISQGLPPVSAPTNVAPGTPDQAKLSVAAATATTLASLPKQTVTNPGTTVDLAAASARAVADYFAANPVVTNGPTPQQVIDGVAAYFASHPLPAGPQGPSGPAGPPGPPPTSEEITDAFRREVSANPQVLCPIGGTYSSREIALAAGGSTTQFGCFGGDSAPPPSSAGGSGGGGDTSGGAGNAGEGAAATPSPEPTPAANVPAPERQQAPQQADPTTAPPTTRSTAPAPAPVTVDVPSLPLIPVNPGGVLKGILG